MIQEIKNVSPQEMYSTEEVEPEETLKAKLVIRRKMLNSLQHVGVRAEYFHELV